MPSVLRVAAFRRVWLASLASNCGSWLQVVAAGWLILEMTGSPAAVGALALVARGPAFVLSTVGGQLADRFSRRHVAAWTFGLQGISSGAMAVLAATGHLNPAIIFIFTFALGVGFALGLPAMLALIPALVPPPQLPGAVALNAAGINVARLAGPAIGGVLLDVAGATWCFSLNALSFVWLIAVLYTVRPRETVRRMGVTMRSALRLAIADPAIRRLLVGMTVFALCASPIQELAPVIADRLDAGPRGLGFLLGAMGAGALVGTWLLAVAHRNGMGRATTLPLATLLCGMGMVVVALSPWIGVSLAAMAFCGSFWIWLFIDTNTAIQLRAPTSMVGRMLGLYQLSVVAPIAVGAALAGVAAEWWGVQISLAIAAAFLCGYGIYGLLRRVALIDAGRLEEVG